MDETSAAKGHDYVSVFMAMDSRGVPFATRGKDAATVSAFAEDVAAHGGDPGNVYFSQRTQHGAGHAMTVSVAVVGAITLLCLGLVWLLPKSAPQEQH